MFKDALRDSANWLGFVFIHFSTISVLYLSKWLLRSLFSYYSEKFYDIHISVWNESHRKESHIPKDFSGDWFYWICGTLDSLLNILLRFWTCFCWLNDYLKEKVTLQPSLIIRANHGTLQINIIGLSPGRLNCLICH
jgi:hypothetical protein